MGLVTIRGGGGAPLGDVTPMDPHMLLAALPGSSPKGLPQSPSYRALVKKLSLEQNRSVPLILPDHANPVIADPAFAFSLVSCFLFKTTEKAGIWSRGHHLGGRLSSFRVDCL